VEHVERDGKSHDPSLDGYTFPVRGVATTPGRSRNVAPTVRSRNPMPTYMREAHGLEAHTLYEVEPGR